MKIVASTYDASKNRFTVEASDGKRFFLSYETVETLGLYAGTDHEDLPQEALEHESQLLEARHRALSLVARRAMSSGEIREKLKQKKFDAELIDETLDWLADKNLLDDARYLENFVKDQIELKGYGLWKIAANASAKGFDRESTEAVYARLTDLESDQARARAFADKKWPMIRGNSLMHRKKKISDQLRSRGFSYEVISDVLEGLPE